jgi:long-chain acyl-CoA synthetase
MKRTVIGMLHYASETFGDRPYLCVKGDKGYNQKSYKETEARVFAASLLGLGFERNSKVAILSEGSANWVVGEYGTLIAGCISVPLSVKLMPEEVFFRLNHSESRALLVSKNNIGKVLAMLDKVKNRRFCLIYLDDDEETLKQAAAQHNLKQGKDLFAFSRLVEEGKKVYEKKKGHDQGYRGGDRGGGRGDDIVYLWYHGEPERHHAHK